MSDYFQRLLGQSGVHIQPAAPEPAITPVAVAPSAPSFESAGLSEVHEEYIVEPPASAPTLAPAAAPHAPSAEPASEIAPTPLATTPAPAPAAGNLPTIRESTTFIEETVVLAPAQQGDPPPPPASGRDRPATLETERIETPAPPSALPADVLESVLKWIGAGNSSLTAPAPPARTDVAIQKATRSPGAEQDQAAEPPGPDPIKVPERVIEILETAAAPACSAMPVAARPTPPPEAPVIEPAAEAPARISIGSIHVRVEAAPPAPPPSPARVVRPSEPARPSPRPSPKPSLGGGFSKLRRHYILPH